MLVCCVTSESPLGARLDVLVGREEWKRTLCLHLLKLEVYCC